MVSLLVSFAVLLISLSVHEFAHAWTADRFGDPTPRFHGRVSLNPVVHIDPLGTLLLPLLAIASGAPIIGWAKPVPVNVGRLRRHQRDFLIVAAAGPVSNLMLAVIASMLIRATTGGGGLDRMLFLAFQLNLLLAVFNLIPIPPLDGGNILGSLLSGNLADGFNRLRPYGFLLLYVLLLTGTLGYILGPPYFFLSRVLRP
ncbi:MAG: site-2 protease family protein [Acidobacteria bacterium]|nr:site-2 protease family protein [Acidobacteriota bacterium]